MRSTTTRNLSWLPKYEIAESRARGVNTHSYLPCNETQQVERQVSTLPSMLLSPLHTPPVLQCVTLPLVYSGQVPGVLR
jgi:hypothetical protein